MKKIFIFFALLAGIAVMTGCQKDQELVTLKAIIGQDTKAYFGGSAENIPYWDATDEVYVKGLGFTQTFGLTNPNTTVATIQGVPASDVYSAIFPASMVISMDTPHPTVYNDRHEIETPAGTSALIYFNPHQYYKETGGHQQVDMPMGAVTEDDALIFKNLCSIIRLTVTNDLASSTVEGIQHVDFDVHRLTVQAFGQYLAGYSNVTLSSVDDPVVNMATPNHQTTDNVISVYASDYSSIGTITQTGNTDHKTFDIVVPPFVNATNLVLEVEMSKHTTDGSKIPLGYYEYEVGRSVSVARNKIVPITLSVDRYKPIDYAYLESGSEFNADMQTLIRNHPNVNAIKFNLSSLSTYIAESDEWVEGSTPSGWVELQASYSPRKIYGYVVDNTITINSFATSLYAHSNCSGMFAYLTNIVNIQTTQQQLFITEDVTDMSYMFAGLPNLSILQGISFNTTNVTNMAHMFDGCSIGSLTLPFNTHHLRGDGMVAMFKNCSNLQTLTISQFTTEQITSMEDLFSGCASLTTVSLNSFNTAGVTNMKNMFNGCAALTSLNLSSFNTAQVTNMQNMFNGCTALVNLDLSLFNTAQVTNMQNMFNGCVVMANLYLNNFNMSNVSNENKLNMFKDMANNKIPQNPCTVYCPESVQQAVLVTDGNGNYYSGLDDQNSTGNYYNTPYYDSNIGGMTTGRRIVFARPTTSK